MQNQAIRVFVIVFFCFFMVSCCHKKISHGPAGLSEKVDANEATLFIQIDMASPRGLGTVTGTGVGVANNDGITYVLTAGHICHAVLKEDILAFDIMLWTNKGKAYYSKIFSIDENFDLCLLTVQENLPIAKVAKSSLSVGNKIAYSGYPAGFYSPGVINRFDGYMAGQDMLGDHLYNLPATGGSSGSPIYGKDGKVYAIVSAVMRDFEHMVFAVGTENINKFLKTSGVKPAR